MTDFYNLLMNHLEALAAENAKLREEARTDHLTGLGNLRRMDAELTDWSQRAHRIGIIFFDLANLKKANDTRGHDTGNDFIRLAAKLMTCTKRCTRAQVDLAVRFGGDEFVVALYDATLSEAQAVRDRIEKDFGRHPLGPDDSVFLSGGCALWEPSKSYRTTIREASQEMQRRKGAVKEILQTAT